MKTPPDDTPAGMAVLYVEDEANDIFFMRWAFQRASLNVYFHTVTDGQRAIDYLSGKAPYQDRREHPFPSLILLDLHLPVVPGFEVLKWIRAQENLRNLPVIIFSSSSRPDDERKATQLGANQYIYKPSSGLEFSTVASCLKERWFH